MNVPQTGSFLSSPPDGTGGGRVPALGPEEEARNISPNPLRTIPITDRKTVMIRMTAIISRIARNISYFSLTGATAPHHYLFFCAGGLLNWVSTVCPSDPNIAFAASAFGPVGANCRYF